MRKVAVLCIFALACGKGSTSGNKSLTTSSEGTKIQGGSHVASIQGGSHVASARAKAELQRKIHQLKVKVVQAGWNLRISLFVEDKPETLKCLALLLGRQPIATAKQVFLDNEFKSEDSLIRVDVKSSFENVVAFIERHKTDQPVEIDSVVEQGASLEKIARGRGWHIRKSMFLSHADYVSCLQKILTIDTPVDTGEVEIVADDTFMVISNAVWINCNASAQDIVEYLTE